VGPCFQRPGFEKDGMLGQRAETFGRQVFFSSACNSPAYLLGADVFCVDMDCPHNHVFLILEPMAGSGPGSSQPPLRMTPKRHLCGHPAAQQAHSVAHPLPPPPGSENNSIQTESAKRDSSNGDKSSQQ